MRLFWLGIGMCGALAAGCSSASDPCETICATAEACGHDTGAMDEAQCVATCEEFSEDPAYADAVQQRATCLDELDTEQQRCDLFACTPSGE